MKKIVCLLLALTMLCGLASPAFAEEINEPVENEVELVGAELVFIPLHTLITFMGMPTNLSGVVLLLKYSDGTNEIKIIRSTDTVFFVGDYPVLRFCSLYQTGLLSANFSVNNQFELTYYYFVLPTLF